MDDFTGYALGLTLMGFIGGIVLFLRGLLAYRRDRLISAVATSTLDGLAAGEVRVSGVVQAIDQVLTSPLQSRPCVWYRARVEATDDERRVLFDEERAVHFRIADAHGQVRVVPSGARWEIGPAFDESTGISGAEPPGLDRRRGAGSSNVVPEDPALMTEAQRQAAIDALLTVSQPMPTVLDEAGTAGRSAIFGSSLGAGRRYREARLEAGETVTILGQALPWADVREHLQATVGGSNVDRDMAEDIAAARAAGKLAASPEEAWGNAAIPGFGVGRPTRPPALDPDAARPEVGDAAAHADALERYDIPDESLVLARAPGSQLAIYQGTPETATQVHDSAFLIGLMGAVMSVCCVLALAAVLTGSL